MTSENHKITNIASYFKQHMLIQLATRTNRPRSKQRTV